MTKRVQESLRSPDTTASTLEPPTVGRVDAVDVSRQAGARRILQELSLSVEPGELVAIAGGSGAGKSTLLEILAGLQPPSAGQVRHDGVVRGARVSADSRIGYVPQDDIIHLEMPLRRTLRYAARLRLPAGTSAAEADRIVEETMQDLDLADRAEVPVRALSGGQRKRASIAVELLTRPHLFFLDEPTSGLDPSTAADVMRLLRRLSRRGVTVVLTTHEPAGIDRCDRVVFLARDGHLAFTGSPTEARRYFGVEDLAEVYDRLAREHTPQIWAERFADSAGTSEAPPGSALPSVPPIAATRSDLNRTGMVRQWWLLTRRNVDVLLRNRLTLAVLLGSPVLVTAMMATLFQRGAFDPRSAADLGPAQIVFWIAFAGFFFGLTYGLLQIVGEMPVFRQERLAGLSVGAYVASKVTALLPVLAGVSALLLGVLRALGRLPAVGWDVSAFLFVTIVIEATSALALGLLASAAVSNAAQAALALPMLCFPQVLFGGAIVPVDEMAIPGRLMSLGLSNRHAFEALGRDLDLDRYSATLPAMSAYGDTFHGGTGASLIALASFAVALTLATVWVLDRRSRPGASRR
ncbi:ABC-type multidrug transport system ATPase subunit/ABC-type multidrug transport system permease subunit [Rhodococcus percolatus]|uniref:ABC transporter ATP-binding protein/permease n=1 Tax=Rhodococcus opacus TaxID=37919 RepID=UPI0018517607|nr:ABC-type multidrug transport system ATPase subunit/ABC-type multidrug transport system permease subunit [Rhodococcus opacus]MBP2206328.1 ABC-type multidrug transport system ATPase subunit/ABC-type multidrug transport system permease subunit [Rhodococcus opacus]